jgi:hypothetical protein
MDDSGTLSVLKKYGTTEDDLELYKDSGDRALYALGVYLDKDTMARIEQMHDA